MAMAKSKKKKEAVNSKKSVEKPHKKVVRHVKKHLGMKIENCLPLLTLMVRMRLWLFSIFQAIKP